MESLIIVHPRRCGSHAIMNWIYQHAPRPRAFRNLWTPRSRKWEKTLSTRDPLTNDEGPFKFAMTNFEDYGRYGNWENIQEQGQRVAAQPEVEHLTHEIFYLCRSLYNFAASRIQKKTFDLSGEEAWIPELDIPMWMEYARKGPILFDKWFQSREYRDHVAQTIGFVNEDKGLDDVTFYGWGSSFDKQNFDGRAQAMKVLERYKQVELPDFPEEAHALNEEVFGWRL
jgi:hypothetical protein